METREQQVRYAEMAKDAERTARAYRGRALVCGSMMVALVLAMVGVRGAGAFVRAIVVLYALFVLGAGTILMGHSYCAWGIQRLFQAAADAPDPVVVAAERRRSAWLAALFGCCAVVAAAFMPLGDVHKWLGPIAGVVLLIGCAGVYHYCQVWDISGRLLALLIGPSEAGRGAAEQGDEADEAFGGDRPPGVRRRG